MDDFTDTLDELNRYLRDATATEPLTALTAIGTIQRDISDRQREAVREAIKDHSWAEVGEALGVTKQAAHQKFAKEWAQELRSEIRSDARTMKAAYKRGDAAEAAAATAKLITVAEEMKTAGGRKRR